MRNRLRFVTYNCSGSMLGGHYIVEYNGGKKTVTINEQQTHCDPEKIRTEVVGIECGKAIRAIIDKYDMCKWAELPSGELMGFDAATESLSIWFENGETYNISEMQALPDKGFEAIREVRDCMLAFAESNSK